MKLKRINRSFYYHENKVSEYALLTEYNPKFINTKLKGIKLQIETMYSLNISCTTVSDVFGVVSVSYPLDKLVIKIIEEKEKLERFKSRSLHKINLLKSVIKQYTPREQKEIMIYLNSNGSAINYELIERLQRDLYKAKRLQPKQRECIA